ncbi:MAG: hypothetical protein ACR2I2_03160 [Bryobacteraceae bacterium]
MRLVRESGCLRVGIDYAASALEYPLQMVRETNSRVQFFHMTVPHDDACAVVCFDCAGGPAIRERYIDFDRVELPSAVVYKRRTCEASRAMSHEQHSPRRK